MQPAQIGCGVAHLNAAKLSRVQRSSIGCSVAQEGAAELKRVQRSSVRCNVCSLAQGKNICPSLWRPEFGPEEKHFVSGNSRFFYFWGSGEAAMGGGGRAAPRWAYSNEPKKTGARSAPARTRGQNPLVCIDELSLAPNITSFILTAASFT